MDNQLPTKEFEDAITDYGLEFLKAKPRFRALMWHRGSRKTTYLLVNSIVEAHKKVGLYWFIGPYLTQTKATVWTDPSTSVFRWIPKNILEQCKVNHSDNSITFPNGSVWQIKGADKPDSLRGPKPLGITVDEYGEIAKRHGASFRETVLEPSIRSSKGWIDYGGTPKGENDFSYIVKLGREGKNPEWWSSLKTVEDTSIYNSDEIENIKRNVTNLDLFYQEYYCRVLEGASSVFKGHYKCIKGKLEEPIPGHSYVFGIDLARTFDCTAIVGFDIHTNHLVYFKTLTNEPWALQIKTILSVLGRYNKAQAVVDSTGMGDAPTEQLVLAGANVAGFKIQSNQIKRALIEKLAMFLENQYLSYPDIEEIKDELNSFEYEVTASNNVTYSAPVGKHDDIVLAMALGVQLLNVIPTPFREYTREEEARAEMEVDPRTGYWK